MAATFRAAMTKIRTEAGGPLDDDAALLLLARQVLAGPSDDGRASYQLELSVCEQCQRTQQVAQGELVEVSAEVAAMVRCDAQQLASPHVGKARGSAGPARRKRWRLRCGEPCPSSRPRCAPPYNGSPASSDEQPDASADSRQLAPEDARSVAITARGARRASRE
jgi:hypothetical protein